MYKEILMYTNEKGQWHREDGPAVIFGTGTKWWYLNGIEYTELEHEQEVIKIKLKRLIYKNN